MYNFYNFTQGELLFMNKNIVFNCVFSILVIVLIIFFSKKISNDKSEKSLTIEPGILRIGTEYGYPPFEYLDTDGKTLIGFDVDLWNELCKRLEFTPKIYDTQWMGLFSSLETNRYDCVISAVTITPERKEKFLITKPYVQNAQCFVVKKDFSKKVDTPKALEGIKVAYQNGTVSKFYVDDLISQGYNLEVYEYDKLMDAFDDLKFGRVDVVVAESVASKILVKNNLNNYRIDFYGEADAFFGILVNKENIQLFTRIQETLDNMYQDGFMKSLEEKWLNVD